MVFSTLTWPVITRIAGGVYNGALVNPLMQSCFRIFPRGHHKIIQKVAVAQGNSGTLWHDNPDMTLYSGMGRNKKCDQYTRYRSSADGQYWRLTPWSEHCCKQPLSLLQELDKKGNLFYWKEKVFPVVAVGPVVVNIVLSVVVAVGAVVGVVFINLCFYRSNDPDHQEWNRNRLSEKS